MLHLSFRESLLVPQRCRWAAKVITLCLVQTISSSKLSLHTTRGRRSSWSVDGAFGSSIIEHNDDSLADYRYWQARQLAAEDAVDAVRRSVTFHFQARSSHHDRCCKRRTKMTFSCAGGMKMWHGGTVPVRLPVSRRFL